MMKKVNKLVLDNAKNLAIKLSSAEIRKRVFVLSAAAMSVSDLLDDGELKLKHKNSLFKITSLDDVLEIADLYSDDIRVDVRVVFDENVFCIPKSHEKFYATPEIYLVVRMTDDVENIEPLGYIESSQLPQIKSDTEYLEYDINLLKPISGLKNALSKIEKKQQIFSKEAHAKIEELAIAFLDGEISDSEKVFFIQHVMKCSFCREKLSEMNEFDNVVRQLNKYPDLLNDQTLDILTGALTRAYSLPEAQPVFLPEEDEEQTLIIGQPLDTDDYAGEQSEETEDLINTPEFAAEEVLPDNEEKEETPFLLEYPEENNDEKMSQETLLELGAADVLNAEEIAGTESGETVINVVENIPELSIVSDADDSVVNEIKTGDDILDIQQPQDTEKTTGTPELKDSTDELLGSNNTEDDFLLDFADDEAENDITMSGMQEESGVSAESFPAESDSSLDSISDSTDTFNIIDGKNQDNSVQTDSFELSELTPDEEINAQELPQEPKNEDITLDMIDADDEILEEESSSPLEEIREPEDVMLEEEPVNDHLLLLGDEPELLTDDDSDLEIKEEIEDLPSDSIIPAAEEPEKNESILAETADIVPDENLVNDSLTSEPEIDAKPETEEEGITAQIAAPVMEETDNDKGEEKEELSEDLQAMFDDDLRSLLDASDDDLVEEDTAVSSMQAETVTSSSQQLQEDSGIAPELQSIMDDELMSMLADDSVHTVNEDSAGATSVPKQIAQKLSSQPENGDIEMLYDETNPSGGQESKITVEEPPVVKSAVSKTKKLAVSLFVFLILLAGGTTTYFMKFGKSLPGQPDSDENSTDGAALFDFGNKNPEAEEEPAVPQDINKSMTNVFSEQPSALTITKISWNVNDKLAQNDAFKNYLQVAGKNLQINLQNDLANTTEFAYNNKIHLNFQVTKNNEIKNLQVLDSSGSEQIDNVVLRSIKETLKYVNAPNIKDVKGDYNLSLIINF